MRQVVTTPPKLSKKSLQSSSYVVSRKPKAKGDHLYDFEIQWTMLKSAQYSSTMHKHTVTFGITDSTHKGKRDAKTLRGYIRCSPVIHSDAHVLLHGLQQGQCNRRNRYLSGGQRSSFATIVSQLVLQRGGTHGPRSSTQVATHHGRVRRGG